MSLLLRNLSRNHRVRLYGRNIYYSYCNDIIIDSGRVIEMSYDNILDPSVIFKINEH